MSVAVACFTETEGSSDLGLELLTNYSDKFRRYRSRNEFEHKEKVYDFLQLEPQLLRTVESGILFVEKVGFVWYGNTTRSRYDTYNLASSYLSGTDFPIPEIFHTNWGKR